MPFQKVNDIGLRPAKGRIEVGDDVKYYYGPTKNNSSHHNKRRAYVLCEPPSATIWPGEYVEVSLPGEIFDTSSSHTFALEPRPIQQISPNINRRGSLHGFNQDLLPVLRGK